MPVPAGLLASPRGPMRVIRTTSVCQTATLITDSGGNQAEKQEVFPLGAAAKRQGEFWVKCQRPADLRNRLWR